MGQKLSIDWEKTIREQRESGESIKAFCKSRGFNPATFYNHRNKLHEKDFVQVVPRKEKDTGTPGKITLHYKDLQILVEKDFCKETLLQVLTFLREMK